MEGGASPMRVLLLQGEFESWYTLPTGVRTYTVKFPGPDPFTETHVSVLPQVGEATLEDLRPEELVHLQMAGFKVRDVV